MPPTSAPPSLVRFSTKSPIFRPAAASWQAVLASVGDSPLPLAWFERRFDEAEGRRVDFVGVAFVADEGLVRDEHEAAFEVDVFAVDRAARFGGQVEFGVAGPCAFLERAGELDVDVAPLVAADVDAEREVEVGAFDPFEGRVFEHGLRVFVGAAAAAARRRRRRRSPGRRGLAKARKVRTRVTLELLLGSKTGARWYGINQGEGDFSTRGGVSVLMLSASGKRKAPRKTRIDAGRDQPAGARSCGRGCRSRSRSASRRCRGRCCAGAGSRRAGGGRARCRIILRAMAEGSVAETKEALAGVGYLADEPAALVSFLAQRLEQAGPGRGPGGGRQDRAGQGALAGDGPRAGPPPVLRGPRRGQGDVRVELPQAAAADPGRRRGGLGRRPGRHLQRRSSCSSGR